MTPDQDRMEALTQANLRLLRRVSELEGRVAELEAHAGIVRAAPEPPPAPLSAIPPLAPADAVPSAVEPEPPVAAVSEDPPRTLETRVGLAWINRIAVVTCILAAAFFFKYAVDNEWIGPSGRVILGVIAGLAFLGAADRFFRRGERVYGQGLCGLGLSVLYLSFQASFAFYHLIPQGAAFCLMALVTALGGALALRYDARAIAVLGLLGGFATPPLLSTGRSDPVFLMTYLFVLCGGAMLVARRKRWASVERLAAAGTALILSFAVELSLKEDNTRYVAAVLLPLFYALFAATWLPEVAHLAQLLATVALGFVWAKNGIASTASSLALTAAGFWVTRARGWETLPLAALPASWYAYWLWAEPWRTDRPIGMPVLAAIFLFLTFAVWVLPRRPATRSDLVLVVANASLFFASLYPMLDKAGLDAYHGLVAAAIAAVHLVFGWWLTHRDRGAALIYLGIALVLITLAIPLQFSEFGAAIGWSLEGAAFAWIASRTGSKNLSAVSVAIFLLALLRLDGAPFLAFAVCAASLGATAWWTAERPLKLGSYVAAHAVLLVGLGIQVVDWAKRMAPESPGSASSLAISILCAIYAVAMTAVGVATKSALNRILGLILIAFVIAKLYLYDVWELRLIYRVVAFGALGAIMLAMSYLYSRYRARIESWWRQ